MRFEVVPSALFGEAARLRGLPTQVRELSHAASATVAAGAVDAGGPAAGAGLDYFGARLTDVLGQLEATLDGVGTAMDAAGARYAATDRAVMPRR
jgi:hypothetical protein